MHASSSGNDSSVTSSDGIAEGPGALADDCAGGAGDPLGNWLWLVATQRDQVAFAQLYDATVHRVYNVALRFVGDVECAEDLVADVYTELWDESQKGGPQDAPVMAWLLVCCRNRAFQYLRDNGSTQPGGARDVAPRPTGNGMDADLLQETQSDGGVHDALAAMSPLQRHLLSLAFFRGSSCSEIAASEGIAPAAVESNIRAALACLRGALGEYR